MKIKFVKSKTIYLIINGKSMSYNEWKENIDRSKNPFVKLRGCYDEGGYIVPDNIAIWFYRLFLLQILSDLAQENKGYFFDSEGLKYFKETQNEKPNHYNNFDSPN